MNNLEDGKAPNLARTLVVPSHFRINTQGIRERLPELPHRSEGKERHREGGLPSLMVSFRANRTRG